MSTHMKHGLAAESPSRMPPPPTKRTNRMQSPNWAAAGTVAMGVATPERPWTVEERQAIRNAVIEHGEQEWAKVVAAMQPYGRTADECRRHWTLTYPLVKGAWTKAEDELLSSLVKQGGPRRWSKVSGHIPGRNAKQCRERWVNHLDPTVNKGPWQPDEDRLLVAAQKELGNRWSEIAKRLPGRPDNAVKNRWYCMKNRQMGSQKNAHKYVLQKAPGGMLVGPGGGSRHVRMGSGGTATSAMSGGLSPGHSPQMLALGGSGGRTPSSQGLAVGRYSVPRPIAPAPTRRSGADPHQAYSAQAALRAAAHHGVRSSNGPVPILPSNMRPGYNGAGGGAAGGAAGVAASSRGHHAAGPSNGVVSLRAPPGPRPRSQSVSATDMLNSRVSPPARTASAGPMYSTDGPAMHGAHFHAAAPSGSAGYGAPAAHTAPHPGHRKSMSMPEVYASPPLTTLAQEQAHAGMYASAGNKWRGGAPGAVHQGGMGSNGYAPTAGMTSHVPASHTATTTTSASGRPPMAPPASTRSGVSNLSGTTSMLGKLADMSPLSGVNMDSPRFFQDLMSVLSALDSPVGDLAGPPGATSVSGATTTTATALAPAPAPHGQHQSHVHQAAQQAQQVLYQQQQQARQQRYGDPAHHGHHAPHMPPPAPHTSRSAHSRTGHGVRPPAPPAAYSMPPVAAAAALSRHGGVPTPPAHAHAGNRGGYPHPSPPHMGGVSATPPRPSPGVDGLDVSGMDLGETARSNFSFSSLLGSTFSAGGGMMGGESPSNYLMLQGGGAARPTTSGSHGSKTGLSPIASPGDSAMDFQDWNL